MNTTKEEAIRITNRFYNNLGADVNDSNWDGLMMDVWTSLNSRNSISTVDKIIKIIDNQLSLLKDFQPIDKSVTIFVAGGEDKLNYIKKQCEDLKVKQMDTAVKLMGEYTLSTEKHLGKHEYDNLPDFEQGQHEAIM